MFTIKLESAGRARLLVADGVTVYAYSKGAKQLTAHYAAHDRAYYIGDVDETEPASLGNVLRSERWYARADIVGPNGAEYSVSTND